MPVTKTAAPVVTKRTVVPLAAATKTAKPAPAPAKPKLAVAKTAPAPAPKAAPAETKERAPSTRGIAGAVAGKKVKKLVENPKRPNTKAYDMWEATQDGMTYPELLAAGVSSADIKYNVEHEFIKFV